MPAQTPIACTLPGSELSARLESARELGGRALVGVSVADRRALLSFDGEREGVEAFVAAESQCCPFFDFDIQQHGARRARDSHS